MAVWWYGGVAGIDLGAGLCAMEGDKRWMMLAAVADEEERRGRRARRVGEWQRGRGLNGR